MNIVWESENRFHIGDTRFRAFKLGMNQQQSTLEQFVFQKPREMIERYASLIAEDAPQHIFELGIWRGGSPVFLQKLAGAEKVVSVDLSEERIAVLDEYRRLNGLEHALRPYYGVDQADQAALRTILAQEFESTALDLVIDDASHFLDETRTSFNTLFPAMRPGGKYVIEDWSWAHDPLEKADDSPGFYPEREPLTRLLFELLLACGTNPGIVESIEIDHFLAVVTRGSEPLDPEAFDICRCSLARGRQMLR